MLVPALAFSVAAFLYFGVSASEAFRWEIQSNLKPKAPLAERVALFAREGIASLLIRPKTRKMLDTVGMSHYTYLKNGLLAAGIGGVLGFLAFSPVWGVVLALLGFGTARLNLGQKYSNWQFNVERRIGDLIIALKIRLLAGETVEHAVSGVLPQLDGPLKIEWEKVLSDRNSGASLQEALAGFADRIYSRDVFAVVAKLQSYIRDHVPEDPFGDMSAHIARIQTMNREYVVKKLASRIDLSVGLSMMAALVCTLGPFMYLVWVNTVSGIGF